MKNFFTGVMAIAIVEALVFGVYHERKRMIAEECETLVAQNNALSACYADVKCAFDGDDGVLLRETGVKYMRMCE